MWRESILVMLGISLSSCTKDAPETPEVKILRSKEPGWTKAEIAILKSEEMKARYQTEEYSTYKGRPVKSAALILTRETAQEELERQGISNLDEEEEAAAQNVITTWLGKLPARDVASLHKLALEQQLLECAPASFKVLQSIRQKHNIDCLGADFAPFTKAAEVKTFLAVEFYQFSSRLGGGQDGLLVHDPECDFKDWAIGSTNYTMSDIRIEAWANSVPDYLDPLIEGTLESTAMAAYEEGKEKYEPDHGEDLLHTLPLLNEAFGFQFPNGVGGPFWKTDEKINYGAGHQYPAPLKPEGEFYDTIDKIGVLVPKDSIDVEYLDSLKWPRADENGLRTHTVSKKLLCTAIERMDAGEAGTALVILRNYHTALLKSRERHKNRVSWMSKVKTASSVLFECYLRLDRPSLAGRVIERTRQLCEP